MSTTALSQLPVKVLKQMLEANNRTPRPTVPASSRHRASLRRDFHEARDEPDKTLSLIVDAVDMKDLDEVSEQVPDPSG